MSTTDWEALFSVARDTCGREPTATDDDFRAEYERHIKRAEERGRNEAVEIVKAIGFYRAPVENGFEDEETWEVSLSDLETARLFPSKARTPNEATEARGEDINKTTNP